MTLTRRVAALERLRPSAGFPSAEPLGGEPGQVAAWLQRKGYADCLEAWGSGERGWLLDHCAVIDWCRARGHAGPLGAYLAGELAPDGLGAAHRRAALDALGRLAGQAVYSNGVVTPASDYRPPQALPGRRTERALAAYRALHGGGHRQEPGGPSDEALARYVALCNYLYDPECEKLEV